MHADDAANAATASALGALAAARTLPHAVDRARAAHAAHAVLTALPRPFRTPFIIENLVTTTKSRLSTSCTVSNTITATETDTNIHNGVSNEDGEPRDAIRGLIPTQRTPRAFLNLALRSLLPTHIDTITNTNNRYGSSYSNSSSSSRSGHNMKKNGLQSREDDNKNNNVDDNELRAHVARVASHTVAARLAIDPVIVGDDVGELFRSVMRTLLATRQIGTVEPFLGHLRTIITQHAANTALNVPPQPSICVATNTDPIIVEPSKIVTCSRGVNTDNISVSSGVLTTSRERIVPRKEAITGIEVTTNITKFGKRRRPKARTGSKSPIRNRSRSSSVSSLASSVSTTSSTSSMSLSQVSSSSPPKRNRQPIQIQDNTDSDSCSDDMMATVKKQRSAMQQQQQQDQQKRLRQQKQQHNQNQQRVIAQEQQENIVPTRLTKDDNATKFTAGRLRAPVQSDGNAFITGSEKMQQDLAAKNGGSSMFGGGGGSSSSSSSTNRAGNVNSNAKKALGSSGRRAFVPPVKRTGQDDNQRQTRKDNGSKDNGERHDKNESESIPNIPDELSRTIANEIISARTNVTWDDIVGLENAKKSIMEIVVWPMLRPDLFSGIRGPSKGLLLFGPPGTGKTLIGKCIASQSNATFFSISSSSLTSKWIGEGEKLVRALFQMASIKQPSVIFIDEIDSLLTQRSEGEVEATRRIKTEFLVQFDGCGTRADDRVLVIGATNRPQELDEAARRRFRKKLYIPLPSAESRRCIVENLLMGQLHSLSSADMAEVVSLTEGYSGSDMDGLVREAALGPIREITDINGVSLSDVRGVSISDFRIALRQVRKSVGEHELQQYERFAEEFGSSGL